MKELQKIRLFIRLFFKWWTLSALLGVGCPPIHQSVFFSRKFRRTTNIFLYIKFKKNGELADDRMVKPKKADKKADRAKKVDEPFLPSSSPLPPYLILIPHAHGNGGAQVQGTVSAKYCGSASRPSFEHFSFILGPVMLTTVGTMKYERTKLTHPSGSGAAVSVNQVRAPDGSSQAVQN